MREFKTAGELVRVALIYAIQDREAMLGCLSSDDEHRPEVVRELEEFRAYYLKRFCALDPIAQDQQDLATGKTQMIPLSQVKENDTFGVKK